MIWADHRIIPSHESTTLQANQTKGKTMKIINCTPHPITVQTTDTEKITLPASGKVIRVDTIPSQVAEWRINGIPVAEPDLLGEVYMESIKPDVDPTRYPLPKEQTGIFYLVSAVVGFQLKGKRGDILVGASAPKDKPIRHPQKGFIMAVRRLKKV